MSRGDSLGDRMKMYEKVSRTKLMRRTPVIIRLDGKAFHTYTKGCNKPFDFNLSYTRNETMQYLVDNIQGCIFGYSQSDEISLVLKDWDTFKTDAWFDNQIQKIVSVSASMCTMIWNRESVRHDLPSGALFDARAFNVPKEEVINYLIWRQQDWERNSKQMLARAYFSHKECHGLNCQELITKVEQELGIVWGELPDYQKRGEFYIKGGKKVTEDSTPIFKDEREGLEKLLYEERNNV